METANTLSAYGTFALRPNESIHFRKHLPEQSNGRFLYAIMLHRCPAFPGVAQHKRPLAVLVAQRVSNGWRSLAIEAVTKQLLAQHLLRSNTYVDRWYIMEVIAE